MTDICRKLVIHLSFSSGSCLRPEITSSLPTVTLSSTLVTLFSDQRSANIMVRLFFVEYTAHWMSLVHLNLIFL